MEISFFLGVDWYDPDMEGYCGGIRLMVDPDMKGYCGGIRLNGLIQI